MNRGVHTPIARINTRPFSPPVTSFGGKGLPSPPILLEPPPAPELARLFRRKVERLEETLNAEPTLTSKAAPILRTLIDGIVLHPRKKRGTMPIEVYGEPSALFLLANDDPSYADNWMYGGSGGANPP
jgi:hypothetical protein